MFQLLGMQAIQLNCPFFGISLFTFVAALILTATHCGRPVERPKHAHLVKTYLYFLHQLVYYGGRAGFRRNESNAEIICEIIFVHLERT